MKVAYATARRPPRTRERREGRRGKGRGKGRGTRRPEGKGETRAEGAERRKNRINGRENKRRESTRPHDATPRAENDVFFTLNATPHPTRSPSRRHAPLAPFFATASMSSTRMNFSLGFPTTAPAARSAASILLQPSASTTSTPLSRNSGATPSPRIRARVSRARPRRRPPPRTPPSPPRREIRAYDPRRPAFEPPAHVQTRRGRPGLGSSRVGLDSSRVGPGPAGRRDPPERVLHHPAVFVEGDEPRVARDGRRAVPHRSKREGNPGEGFRLARRRRATTPREAFQSIQRQRHRPTRSRSRASVASIG